MNLLREVLLMDNKAVYENFDWESLTSDSLKSKISKVVETIPKEVKSIIDIGCGNGIITNILGQKFDVTAIDRSEHALRYIETKKIKASSDSIPLADNSYDMVFSSELLEHLPDDVCEGTISEFKRLSKKYIFITVPNNENPRKLSIKCTKCGYTYNSPNHLRSFDIKALSELFPEHKLINTFTFGKKIRYYNNNILKIKTSISPSSSWIPYYWMSKNKRETTCPSCEYTFVNPYNFNLLSFGCDLLNVTVSPKKPYWLFVVFEKV